MKFDAPIPGSSLTKEPSNSNWEQPPLYDTEEDVLAFYLDRLSDEEVIDDLMFALEKKFPLSTLVDSMTSVGVMEGYHSVDVKMLVSPVLHEHLKTLAETLDIEVVEEDGPSKEDRQALKAKQRMLISLREELDKEDQTPLSETSKEEAAAMLAEEVPTEDDTEQPVPPGGGLIPRRR